MNIKNISEKAAKNYVGEGIEEILKSLIHDNLVFKYVDRSLLAKALEEIELALSDITEDDTRVEIGKIEEVKLLLVGSVTEEQDDFLINIRLVEVETTSLVAASQARIPQADLIKEGNRIAYEYIMANGIGVSAQMSPHYALVYPQEPVVVLADGKKIALDFSGVLSYRLSRNFKLSMDVAFKMHDLYFDNRTYGTVQNVINLADALGSGLWQDDGTLQLSDATTIALISNQKIHYFIQQSVLSFAPVFSFVWPITREFNLSIGAGPSFNSITYIQNYDALAVVVNGGLKFGRRSIVMDFWDLGAKVKVELEYFVLPRLSINAGAAYHYVYVFPPAEVDAYDSTTGEYYYSRSDRAIDAFFSTRSCSQMERS